MVDGLVMEVLRLLIRSSKLRWLFFLRGLSGEELTLVGREMLWSTSVILTPSSNLNRFTFLNKFSFTPKTNKMKYPFFLLTCILEDLLQFDTEDSSQVYMGFDPQSFA